MTDSRIQIGRRTNQIHRTGNILGNAGLDCRVNKPVIRRKTHPLHHTRRLAVLEIIRHNRGRRRGEKFIVGRYSKLCLHNTLLIRRHQLAKITGNRLNHHLRRTLPLQPADIILYDAVLVYQNGIGCHTGIRPELIRQAAHTSLLSRPLRLQRIFRRSDFLARRLCLRLRRQTLILPHHIHIVTGKHSAAAARRRTRKHIFPIQTARMLQSLQNRLTASTSPRVQRRVVDRLCRRFIKLQHPVAQRLIIKITTLEFIVLDAQSLHCADEIGRIPILAAAGHIICHIGRIESLAIGIRFILTNHDLFQIRRMLPDFLLLRALVNTAVRLLIKNGACQLLGHLVIVFRIRCTIDCRRIELHKVFILTGQNRPVSLLNTGNDLVAGKLRHIVRRPGLTLNRTILFNQPVNAKLITKTMMRIVNGITQITLRIRRRHKQLTTALHIVLRTNRDCIAGRLTTGIQKRSEPGDTGSIVVRRQIGTVHKRLGLGLIAVIGNRSRLTDKAGAVCHLNRFAPGIPDQIHTILNRRIVIILHHPTGTIRVLDHLVRTEPIGHTSPIRTTGHHARCIRVNHAQLDIFAAIHCVRTAGFRRNHIFQLTGPPVSLKPAFNAHLLQTANHIKTALQRSLISIPGTIVGTKIDMVFYLRIGLLIHKHAHQTGSGFI